MIIYGMIWYALVAALGFTRSKWTFQGRGLLSQFSPFRYFPHFPLLSKQTLVIEYQVYIWQVLPQLSCGDTCQIWMWFRKSNRYFCKIENCAYGEINERSFSNPHPRLVMEHITDLLCTVLTSCQHRDVLGPIPGTTRSLLTIWSDQ